jgi:peptide/nickel transport system substrate-binding protein
LYYPVTDPLHQAFFVTHHQNAQVSLPGSVQYHLPDLRLSNRIKHRLKIVNDLATGYEVSEDGLVWTVGLRDDAKFSDGEPLTAEDVVYTFTTAAGSGSVIDLSVMEKVEALGENTVVFTLKRAQSTFITILIHTGIVPKHVHGPGYAEDPLGSGPYKFVQWDKGQQLIVEANPEYYGEKPFFKKITFLFLGEDGAFAAAKAGQVVRIAGH